MLLWETLSSPTRCVCQGPSEEENQQNACVCVYMQSQRLGSWDYRGGATPRSEISKTGAQRVALVWVWRPENQDSQWHEFQLDDSQAWESRKAHALFWVQRLEKTGVPVQSSQEDHKEPPLVQPVCSVQVFSWLGEAHTHWGGSSALFGLHIQQFISPRNTHIDTPEECLTQWLSTLWPRQSGTKNSPSLMPLSFQVSDDMLLPPGFLAGPSQDDVKGACYVPHSILFIPCPDTWAPPPLA